MELLEVPGAGEQPQRYENTDTAPIYLYFQKQQLLEQLSLCNVGLVPLILSEKEISLVQCLHNITHIETVLLEPTGA